MHVVSFLPYLFFVSKYVAQRNLIFQFKNKKISEIQINYYFIDTTDIYSGEWVQLQLVEILAYNLAAADHNIGLIALIVCHF